MSDTATHRCPGCGHCWIGGLLGAELCGDCWRKVQPVLHTPASVPAAPTGASSAILAMLPDSDSGSATGEAAASVPNAGDSGHLAPAGAADGEWNVQCTCGHIKAMHREGACRIALCECQVFSRCLLQEGDAIAELKRAAWARSRRESDAAEETLREQDSLKDTQLQALRAELEVAQQERDAALEDVDDLKSAVEVEAGYRRVAWETAQREINRRAVLQAELEELRYLTGTEGKLA